MSERGIFFFNISFPIQDVSGDRRSAGLREPGLLQQLLQMREWDSHCGGFCFKSNKIKKTIHKIKIMIMIMITIMLRNVRTVCSSIRCLRWRTLCTTTVFTCDLSSAHRHYRYRRNYSAKIIDMIIFHILTTTDALHDCCVHLHVSFPHPSCQVIVIIKMIKQE